MKEISKFDNLKNQLKIYRCPYCFLIPEIININFVDFTIHIKCQNHGIYEISISEFLSKQNISNQKCFHCEKNISHNQNIFFYFCNNCKNIFCQSCNESMHTISNKNHHDIIKYNIDLKEDLLNSLLQKTNFNKEEKKDIENNKEIDKIIEKIMRTNNKYKKIIQNYKNLINLNNTIVNSYKEFSNKNNNLLINLKNIESYTEVFTNRFSNLKEINDLKSVIKENNSIENFNKEFDCDLDINTQVICLICKELKNPGFKTITEINFNKIIELQLIDAKITDISYLKNANFPILKELYLYNNLIEDITSLKDFNFPLLKIIYLGKNKIKDISVFRHVFFKDLFKLFLDENLIEDISVFDGENLEKLEQLKLSKNPIKDIKIFKKISGYKFMRLINIRKIDINYSNEENINIIHEIRDRSIRVII